MMLNYDCDVDVFPGGDCSQLFPGGPQHRRQVQAVRSKVDEGDNVIIIIIIIIMIRMMMMILGFDQFFLDFVC